MADQFYVETGYVDSGYFSYTAEAAVLTASLGTLSINANAIKRIGAGSEIPGNNGTDILTGLEFDGGHTVRYTDGTSRTLATNQYISVWAKKNAVSDTNTTIFSFGEKLNNANGDATFRLELLSDRVQVVSNYFNNFGLAGTNTSSWTTSVFPELSIDTEWHHYLIKITDWNVASGTFNYVIRMWQDGQDLGDANIAPGMANLNVATSGVIRFGHNLILNTTITAVVPSVSLWDGCVAQFWYGPITSGFDVSDFYNNGYVDLATNGHSPYVYQTLNTPWNEYLHFYRYDGQSYPNAQVEIYDTVIFDCSNTANAKTLPVTATLSVQPNYLEQASASLSSQFSLLCDADVFKIGSASLITTANLQINADLIGGGIAGIVVATALSARGDGIFRNRTATLATTAQISQANSTYAIFGTGTLSSQFSMRVVTSAEATVAAVSSLTVDPTFTFSGKATLPVTVSITAQGDAGKIAVAFLTSAFAISRAKLTIVAIPDDLTTLFVSEEARGLRVLEETAFVPLEIESRLNRVLQETNNLIVEIENRTFREVAEPVQSATLQRTRRLPA